MRSNDLPWATISSRYSSQSGCSPVSRDAAIAGRRRALVAPCSTVVRDLSSEVVLEPGEEPVDRLCAAQVDSLTDLPVAVLTRRLGRLSDEAMRQLCAALNVAAGCPGP